MMESLPSHEMDTSDLQMAAQTNKAIKKRKKDHNMFLYVKTILSNMKHISERNIRKNENSNRNRDMMIVQSGG